jgi:hypothetical protein
VGNVASETAEDEENMAAPRGVVGGLQVKNDGYEVLDVLDDGSLTMHMSNDRNFRGGVVIAVEGVVVQVALALTLRM